MEFTILFLAVAVVMVAAWWGTRTLALALFAAALHRVVHGYAAGAAAEAERRVAQAG